MIGPPRFREPRRIIEGPDEMDDRMRAEYWRKRADDARWTADRAQDLGMQRTLLRMAMTYDRLASERAGLDDRQPTLRLVHSAGRSGG